MNIKDFAEILVLALGITFMWAGADVDKKERRYPNKIVVITSLLGLIYAFLSDRLFMGVALCVGIHIVGILDGCLLSLLKPGDWKMFATLPLYLPFENMYCFVGFACLLIVNTIYTKIKTLKHINFNTIKESMKHEKDALKCLLLLKEHIKADDEMLSIYKEKTIPMTHVMMAPVIITCIINIINF